MLDVLEIGKRIRECREAKRITQEELGNALGLNKSTIQRYETGKIAKIKLPVLEAMAAELGVLPDYFALKTDSPVINDFHYNTVNEEIHDMISAESGTDKKCALSMPRTYVPELRSVPIADNVMTTDSGYLFNTIDSAYCPAHYLRHGMEYLYLIITTDMMKPFVQNNDFLLLEINDKYQPRQEDYVFISLSFFTDNNADIEHFVIAKISIDGSKIILMPVSINEMPKISSLSNFKKTKIVGKIIKIERVLDRYSI